MTKITTQEWCDIANEIYYHKFIKNGESVLSRVSGSFEPLSYNRERFDAQRLRLADYLAEKCVYVVKEGDNYITKKYWGGDRLTSSKDINLCRALAVLALIGEE